MIYLELDKRNEKRMGRVIKWGSFVAVSFYCVVGVFGCAARRFGPKLRSARPAFCCVLGGMRSVNTAFCGN